jgi:alkylation response protein AidB-like acyl-CoA dehydrogenase
VVKVLAEEGIFKVFIPKEYGGLSGGVLELALVIEELSSICGGIALCFAGTCLGTFPIILFGNEEQKSSYLPEIASGKKLAAFALTEPNAGSDAGNIQTQAKKEGDFYVLNRTKQWITNSGEAETYAVIAMTDKNKGSRGASAFTLEKGMSGFSFGKKENKMGIRASATRELMFENCKVPKENLLGKEGQGFIVTMKPLTRSGQVWLLRQWELPRELWMKQPGMPKKESNSANQYPPLRQYNLNWQIWRPRWKLPEP